jgi:protein KTI12
MKAMPLFMLCGFPCSGKTTRANELAKALAAKGHAVSIISDGSVNVDKSTAYVNSTEEKMARGNLKSELDRQLKDNICVILDSLNYIKGFRYELYCIARSMKTPSCVIQPLVMNSQCLEWHQLAGLPYGSDDIVNALMLRFEQPDGHNRWDKPLFAIESHDPLPVDDICAAIFEHKAVVPKYSTQTQPLSDTNFLHELDRITREIISVGEETASCFVGFRTCTVRLTAPVILRR